jgi:general secretion pathway protein K
MNRSPRHQVGSALLLAMVILTLVSTLAAGMVWQQWRAVRVEAAERARSQSAWILTGALDWARLILREDSRSGGADHLGEPWAVPLAEARLSTFLAADRDHNIAEDGPEAFLSGLITDAQSRYNLRQLVDDQHKIVETQLKGLQRLCDAAGLPGDTAARIAEQLRDAWTGGPDGPVVPRDVSQLAWLGIDAELLERLQPLVVLLPERTPVNLNTAVREVLLAAVEGLDVGGAERLLAARQRKPFATLEEAKAHLPAALQLDPASVSISSNYFYIQGRLRLEDRVLEERSLVQRRQLDIVPLQRERVNRISRAG